MPLMVRRGLVDQCSESWGLGEMLSEALITPHQSTIDHFDGEGHNLCRDV